MQKNVFAPSTMSPEPQEPMKGRTRCPNFKCSAKIQARVFKGSRPLSESASHTESPLHKDKCCLEKQVNKSRVLNHCLKSNHKSQCGSNSHNRAPIREEHIIKKKSSTSFQRCLQTLHSEQLGNDMLTVNPSISLPPPQMLIPLESRPRKVL